MASLKGVRGTPLGGATNDAIGRRARRRETREAGERLRVERAMHLERHHAERPRSQRDVGGDVRLVRVVRAHHDELAFEVEEIARGERAVRVDPQGRAAERIARDDERRPRGEPRETSIADGDLDPGEGGVEQLRTGLVLVAAVGGGSGRGRATAGVHGTEDHTRKAAGELLPQLGEAVACCGDSRVGELGNGGHLNLRPV
jgi:hypothetical protein